MKELTPAAIGLPACFAWITLTGVNNVLQAASTLVGLVIGVVSLYLMLKNLKKRDKQK